MATETIPKIEVPGDSQTIEGPRDVGEIALSLEKAEIDAANLIHDQFPKLSPRHQSTFIESKTGAEDTAENEVQPGTVEYFKARIQELTTIFDKCLLDEALVTDEIKQEASGRLLEVSDELPQLVEVMKREVDRPALREIILTMIEMLKSYDRVRQQIPSGLFKATQDPKRYPYSEATRAVCDSLDAADWDYPQGYYRHENGSVFSENEQKDIFEFLLNHWGYGDNFRQASHYVRLKSGDFLSQFGQHESFWQNPLFLEHIARMVANNSVKPNQWSGYDAELMARALAELGFNDKEQRSLSAAWYSYDRDREDFAETVGRRYIDSMAAMTQLMRVNKNIPHDLFTKFGIRNFYRFMHSPNDLINQWQATQGAAGQSTEKTALVISGVDDHNGALDDEPFRYGPIRPVYTEAVDIIEMARNIVFVRRHFGPIGSLIISAHGSPNSFVLSNRSISKGRLTKYDVLKSKAIARLRNKDYFTNSCKFILDSCSTGVREGIGDAIAGQSKRDVIAPNFNSGSRIRSAKRGKFNILYNQPDHDERRVWQKVLGRGKKTGIHISPKGRKEVGELRLHE